MLATVAMALWALANLGWGRGVGWDEVEFLKATDWIRQGLVPYRDFFEHHTPLTWFCMAPFEGLVRGPGVGPVLWMRWLQVPLWALVVFRLSAWMREDRIPEAARYFSLACLLGTPFFVFSAIEFRVDTLGTLFVILALDRIRRGGHRQAFAAGALLAAAGMANLRFAPLGVAIAVVASYLDLKSQRWSFSPRRLGWMIVGALAALAPWAIYLAATHSFSAMWHWCVTANRVAAANVSASGTLWGFGYTSILVNHDLPGLALELGMLAGGVVALYKIRRPEFLHFLFLAQVANLVFIAFMRVRFFYHFELSLCLAVPFLARSIDWVMERPSRIWGRLVPGFMALSVVVNGFTLATDSDHPTLAYQDAVLKEASRLAPAGSTVLDGCGWLVDAKPAYRFWFLPSLVNVLLLKNMVPSYSVGDLEADPPRLVIANPRLEATIGMSPDVYDEVVTHYLPVSSNLWVPGLSRALSDIAPSFAWKVLEDGDYRVIAEKSLIRHPWFHDPFAFTEPIPKPSSGLVIDPDDFPEHRDPALSWVLDGSPTEPLRGVFHLRRGQILRATFMGQGAIGVMLIPEGTGSLFNPPPKDLTLDFINFSNYFQDHERIQLHLLLSSRNSSHR